MKILFNFESPDGFRSLESLSMTHNTDRDGVSHGKLSRELKIAVLRAKLEEKYFGVFCHFFVSKEPFWLKKDLKIHFNFESLGGFSCLDSLSMAPTTAGGCVSHGNLSRVLKTAISMVKLKEKCGSTYFRVFCHFLCQKNHFG